MRNISIITLSVVILLTASCTGKKESTKNADGKAKSQILKSKKKSKTIATTTSKVKIIPKREDVQVEFENKMADMVENAFSKEDFVEGMDKKMVRGYGKCAGEKSYSQLSQKTIDLVLAHKLSDDIYKLEEMISKTDSDILDQAGDDCEYLIQIPQ
jgi:hypothetical protein